MRKVLRRITLKLAGIVLLVGCSGRIHCQPVPDSLLLEAYSGGISYLALSQLKTDHTGSDFIGEWPTFIYNTSYIPFLGKKGKSAYDSNVFNTLFIHNTLSELYFERPDPSIPPMLTLARKNFHHYLNDGSFNFWPLLERPAHLKCKHQNCRQRRPVNFDYHYGFINNYANIYDDADDTAAGLLACHYSNRISAINNDSAIITTDIGKLLQKFVMYRDTGKRKTNWYNKRLGFRYRTGAYLTWFGPDRKHANFFSWFFPAHKTQNILYGRNEIDCVVNANILRALAITGNTTIPGINGAKKFLRDVISKKVCFTCGVYYPTEFTFHYAMARAITSGVTGFEDLKKNLAEEILARMNDKGYWESQIEDNDIQATLYAVNALMLLDENDTLDRYINNAMGYVIGSRIASGPITHWTAGVFFSGGSAIRYNHIWRSEAYTTALALESIANYKRRKKKA